MLSTFFLELYNFFCKSQRPRKRIIKKIIAKKFHLKKIVTHGLQQLSPMYTFFYIFSLLMANERQREKKNVKKHKWVFIVGF